MIYKNNLPLLERWAFYLMGRLNTIDANTIENIYLNKGNSYGGLIKGEVYYWKDYLENPSDDLFFSFNPRWRLENEGKEITVESLAIKFIEIGWEHVLNRVKNADYCESERSIDETMMSRFDQNPIPEPWEDYSDDFDPFEGLGNWGQGDGY